MDDGKVMAELKQIAAMLGSLQRMTSNLARQVPQFYHVSQQIFQQKARLYHCIESMEPEPAKDPEISGLAEEPSSVAGNDEKPAPPQQDSETPVDPPKKPKKGKKKAG